MELAERKNIRLKGYNYSKAGYYFITICTHKRQKLLSHIVGAGLSRPNRISDESIHSKIQLTAQGEIVKEHLSKLPLKYLNIKIDKYVIMPNHIHLMLILRQEIRRDNPAPTVAVGQVIGSFKYQTTKSINYLNNNGIPKFWQRGYYDHIIRNEQDYQKIWKYIDTNPLKWQEDEYFI